MDPTAFHQFEHAGWESVAGAYEDGFTALTAQCAGALLDAAGVGAGRRVLDVACGPGDLSAAAARRGATVVGVDFASAMVALARRRHPGVSFRQGDAESLPFPDASFDAAVMSFGLLHLARPERALAEARRVLRSRGRVAFTVWAPPDEAVAFGITLGAVRAHGREDVPVPPGPPFFQFSDPETAAGALTAAGFVGAEVQRVAMSWRLGDADELFEAMSGGTVRTGALLRGQTTEARERIRAAMREACAGYARGNGVVLPMPAVLAAASVPAT